MLFARHGAVLTVKAVGEQVMLPPPRVRSMTQGVPVEGLWPYDRVYLSAWYRTAVVVLANDAKSEQLLSTVWSWLAMVRESMAAVSMTDQHLFTIGVYESFARNLGMAGRLDYSRAIENCWSLAWRAGIHADN